MDFIFASCGRDCFEGLFEVAAIDLGEVDVIADGRAFGEENGIGVFARGFFNEGADDGDVLGNGRAEFHLYRADD